MPGQGCHTGRVAMLKTGANERLEVIKRWRPGVSSL